MVDVIAQMGALILCGIAWKLIQPGGLDVKLMRKALTDFVYFLLLPALVLSVLWQAELGTGSLAIALLAALGVLVGIGLGWMSCNWCRLPAPAAGAAILAAAFPNATYMGLPVLETTLGPWARSVAVQYDLFACTPLLFTLGIYLANRFGEQKTAENMYVALLRIPAIWAALAGVALNLAHVPMPAVVDGFLGLLNRGVVPLMLFSLGLSLSWNQAQWRQLPAVIPIAVIQLLITPLIVFAMSSVATLPTEVRTAVILEAAMPSMVIGIVICERFGLDSNLYATAVTATTALSLLSLPMWFALLG